MVDRPQQGDPLSAVWGGDVADACNRRPSGDLVGFPFGEANLPLSPPAREIKGFELYDDMMPGDEDKLAWPLQRDGTRDDSTAPPVMKVSDDFLGNARGYGSHHDYGGGADTQPGAMGWYQTVGGKNQVVAFQGISQKIKVSTSSAVAASATFTSATIAVMDAGGQDPSGGTGVLAGITNYSSAIPAAATGIICVWDESIPGYLVIDAPPPC